MTAHKPTQTPPPVEELVAQLDLVSRYAGEMNQVERFTLDRETGGLPETVALHTLRLASEIPQAHVRGLRLHHRDNTQRKDNVCT